MVASEQESSGDRLMLRLMAAGFGVGSILFIVGAILAWTANQGTSGNVSCAIGALFFTAAAVVQWRAAVAHHPEVHTARRRAELALRNADWTAAIVQLLGTLEFNVMTIRALIIADGSSNLTSEQVWRPDLLGSALFLAASILAWQPIVRLRRHRLLARRSRVICVANLVGSVFFAISALATATAFGSQMVSQWWVGVGTVLGGVGFLIGAVLLWPPAGIKPKADEPTPMRAR